MTKESASLALPRQDDKSKRLLLGWSGLSLRAAVD